MSEIDAKTLAAARQIVAEAERTQKETVRIATNERLEQTLEMALGRMSGDVASAAALFFAWTEQDSSVRDLLKPLIHEAIEARLAKIPNKEPELA